MKPQRRPGRKGNTVALDDGIPQDPAQASLIDKLLGKKGPAVLTDVERAELHAAFSDIAQSNLRLTRMVNGLGEALTRRNLRVTHIKHPDGTLGFDIKNATNEEHVTVN